MLTFNPEEARKADKISNFIRDAGAYKGVITRAEKLVGKDKGTPGVGLSFRADDGSTAAFLDIYTHKATGEPLQGSAIIQALMCCLKLRTAEEGTIKFKTWDNKDKEAKGYPSIMGRRIGFVFRRELQLDQNGDDKERLMIVGVFQEDTGLMASEILDRKTSGELLPKMVQWVQANPVKDSRKKQNGYQRATNGATPGREEGDPGYDDSIPF